MKEKLLSLSLTLTGMFLLALFYTAYFTRDVLLPIILALFFTFLLRPIVRMLKKIKVPEAAGSALVLISFLAIVGFGMARLSDPVQEWIDKAPQAFQQVVQKSKGFMKPIEKAMKTADELKKAAGAGEKKKTEAVPPAPTPNLALIFLTEAGNFLTKTGLVLILLFFLLASGDLFVVKLMHLFRQHQKQEKVKEIVNDIEKTISRYLLTVTLINAGEGILLAIGLHLVGMPDPVLWGIIAALLIYIPYLGPLVGISLVTIVALGTIDDTQKAVLAPIIYLAIELLQAQLVTPMVLGARFSMNPVVILVWLIFWGWLWGIVGALIAVPMLTIFKIFCDHIEPLQPLGEFLSD
jgi:predicted PurR-regulated permease PerM